MKGKIRAILMLIFQLQFAQSVIAVPTVSSEQLRCNRIHACRDDFEENQCDTLGDNPEILSRLTDCSLTEIEKEAGASLLDIAKSCKEGIVQEVLDAIKLITSVPQLMKKNFNDNINAQKLAQKICEENLGYNFKTAYDEKYIHLKSQKLIIWNECVHTEATKIIKLPELPGFKELISMLKDLDIKRRCYKASAQAEAICPLLASFVSGTVGGYALKRASLRFSSLLKNSKGVDDFAKELEDTAKAGKLEKEVFSVEHQNDGINFTKNQGVIDAMDSARLDPEQLRLAILESDAGKIGEVWRAQVLTNSQKSDELLNVLKGPSNSEAGQTMRELMKESGFGDKTLLSRNLSNDDLRQMFSDKKLLRNYLHEMPGMSHAIEELNSGAISAAQFKTRMKANMFHNGPHEAFWKTFGEEYVPGALKGGDEKMAKFFEGTAFDNGVVKDGVVIPVYPSPISGEGILHTAFDRLSGGSRVGMTKIFTELGDEAVVKNPKITLGNIKNFKGEPAGMRHLNEMLIGNPRGSIQQLEALEKHTLSLKNLDAAQKKTLNSVTQSAKKRLETQNKFTSEHMQKFPEGSPSPEKIVLKYTDIDGNEIKKVITSDTPFDEARLALNDFMKAEERLNGDPITQFPGKVKYAKASLAAGAKTTAFTAGAICSKYPRPPKKPKDTTPVYLGDGMI